MKEHRGAEVVGVTGFCWGGMIAMKAASLDPDAEGGVKAGGTVHPAMLSAELAQDVRHGGMGGDGGVLLAVHAVVVKTSDLAAWRGTG